MSWIYCARSVIAVINTSPLEFSSVFNEKYCWFHRKLPQSLADNFLAGSCSNSKLPRLLLLVESINAWSSFGFRKQSIIINNMYDFSTSLEFILLLEYTKYTIKILKHSNNNLMRYSDLSMEIFWFCSDTKDALFDCFRTQSQLLIERERSKRVFLFLWPIQF